MLGIDKRTRQDLDRFLQARLQIRDASTVCRERNTLVRFFQWVVSQDYLTESPAALLEPIPCGTDLPPFRTMQEIEKILAGGGMDEQQRKDVWECLYLAPPEITELLQTVKQETESRVSFFLHAIPAYTGMRRDDVLKLTWMDLDLEESTITARSQKQSRRRRETRRRIDLHDELRHELQMWREEQATGQYIICQPETLQPLTPDQAKRAFWRPLRSSSWCLNSKKNWFKLGFHTYRHSFASNLAAAGVDQRIIDEWMGHQTEAMRKRYRLLFPKNRRSAIECFLFDPTYMTHFGAGLSKIRQAHVKIRQSAL